MMLQGHFVDTLLAVEFRDTTNIFFNIWQYFRGITAPLFFTISGLIFTYLLLKARHNGLAKKRLKKGLNRGLMLIGLGYLLRVPILRWITGKFDTYFLVIDVLQCIGLSLIIIVLIYSLLQKYSFVFSCLMLWIGLIIFITEPFYRNYAASEMPLIFANYFTKVNGSVFTIIPWFGYMAMGAFIAALFHRYLSRIHFKNYAILSFILVGLFLVYYSTKMLSVLGRWTSFDLFLEVADFNYLFIRLGNVFIIFGIFYAFESVLKQSFIQKIGQKTLSIYVIHFIVLYGSFTGLGLNRVIGKTLTGYQAVFGAILFLVSVSFFALYRIKANTIIYAKILSFFKRIKQLFA